MKQSKKLLALLMALVLAFSLALPALAEEAAEITAEVNAAGEVSAAEVDWDDFYIISQPPKEITLTRGSDFTLSVEVNVPAGVEVRYRWKWVAGDSTISTEKELHRAPGDDYYPNAAPARPYAKYCAEYRCEITAVEKDSDGKVVKTAVLKTEIITVTILPEREPTFWETLLERWILGPLLLTVGVCVTTFGVAIPFSPFVWIYYLIFYPVPI